MEWSCFDSLQVSWEKLPSSVGHDEVHQVVGIAHLSTSDRFCLCRHDGRARAYWISTSVCVTSLRHIEIRYLWRVSGLGYSCSRSGQNGHMYPEISWTRPCRIISFFFLNPLPPSLRGQPGTGQKCGLSELWTLAWELRRYCVENGGAVQPSTVQT
jgi:hypothetical protein